MIRLLLAVVGGFAAWRYRGPIREYVNQQLSLPAILGL
jgi:hypothetical protein